MSDDTIQRLFNKLDNLTIQMTKIETLVEEKLLANQEHNVKRLDRHRKDINMLKENIKQLEKEKADKQDVEDLKATKQLVISFKNCMIGFVGVVATCVTLVLGIMQILK